MATGKQPRFCTIIAVLLLISGSGFAQRPNSASLCDYYAQARYGANNSDTQLKFIQNVVCLAFEGGSRLNNVSSDQTGILRPGKFGGSNIDLMQYFNGSRASTNVNNAAIGINWLDQGGTTPLAAFLAGEPLVLANTSNQYHLFGNFFVAFARQFGCTLPPPAPPNTSGPVSLAYAHKFMQLEYNQLGYFINQLAVSAMYFGMSSQDADSFRTKLNSQVNVRCAPAVVSSPNSPPQLFSLCQNDTCPLAVPVADCGAYQNLTAQGISNSNPTSVASSLLTATKTASSSSGTGEPTSANVASQSKGSDKLSTGGIVGAAIGGAAVLLFAVVALVYLFRRRKTHQGQAHPPGWDQQNYGAQGNYPPSGYPPKDPHMSYVSNAQTASEMDTSRYQSLTGSPIASPDLAAHQHQRAYSSQPPEYPRLSPVEMEGTGNGGGGFAHMSPHQNLPPMDFQGHNEQISHQGQERYTQQWTSQNR